MAGPTLVNHLHGDRKTLFKNLADRVATYLQAALKKRERVSLVVPGGSTPVPLFEELSKRDLDWSRVVVTLGDERWVPVDDSSSNERLLRETLLQNKAKATILVGLKNDHEDPESGMADTARALEKVPRPFDVVILGMGEDGHTASLFPHAENLARALDPNFDLPCCAIRAQGAAQPRITLTAPALLACRELILLCTGQAKREVLAEVLKAGVVEDMPVRAILQQHEIPVSIYWAP